MAVADCGWGILFGKNAQNTGDLALIARRAAEDSATPFLNVQDGFLTTHTIENVRLPEPEFMKQYIGAPSAKLTNLMDPDRPVMSGVVQNQDSYMKGKIAQRAYYDRVPAALERAMQEFYEATGRRYGLIEPYRLEDAEYVIVGMGGLAETAQATVDYLRKTEGLRIGTLHVTSFRPFPGPQIVEALKNVRAISVIERMDNPLAESNPLICEIKAAFASALAGTPPYKKINAMPEFLSGSGGLGSRDIRPGDFLAIARNMAFGNGSKQYYFTVGIKHELALEAPFDPDVRPAGAFSMRGHSVGGYGSVTTNKVIATIVGESFGLHVQAYPKYGSEKKGLPTTYYLTVAPEPILTHCELEHVDFVPLNDINAFNLGNPLAGLVPNGMIFIQSDKTDTSEIWAGIPHYAKKIIRQKNLRVYVLDTVGIARDVATTADLIQRMQGIVLLGIFLRVTPFRGSAGLSDEQIFAGVEKSLRKYFGKRGEQVVKDNLTAVKRGFSEVFEIPREVMIGVGAVVEEAATTA
jgi:pyruvate-ferredoxin/flavodoxin oxidoreductase